MNNYEILRKLVYSIIYPKGIPIEEGIELYKEVLYVENKYRQYGIIIQVQGYDEEPPTCDVWWTCGEMTRQPVTFLKILGKPLQLQDILRAISHSLIRDISTTIKKDTQFLTIYTKNKKYIDIDLSLPISQQSPDTIQKLIDLIK